MSNRVIAGELVIFTDGEYSDYGIVATCRALVDFDKLVELKTFAQGPAREAGDDNGDASRFALWLCNRGLIEEVISREIHFPCWDSWEETLRKWERDTDEVSHE